MGKGETAYRTHVLLLPYPTQGHINPILQFAKRLVSKGIKATLVTTIFISNTVQLKTGSVGIELISNGCDQGDFTEVGSVEDYLERLESVGSRTLTELIEKLDRSGDTVSCLIYDPFFAWALDVAKRCSLSGAAFFTQLCIVDAIYYHVYKGNLTVPFEDKTIRLPG